MNKKHIIAISILSIIVIVLVHINLTRAILFEGYLHNDQIIAGRGLYLDEIIESAKGNWRLGSPYIKEWRNQPYLYIPLNINIAGFVKHVFRLSAKTANIVLLYGTLLVMIPAAFVMFLTLFRWHWFGYIVTLGYLFFPGTRAWIDLVSPPLNFIFLFLFLIFYFLRVSEKMFWLREISIGTTAGLLFYTYPYHWTYVLPLLAIFDLWETLKARNIDRRNFVKYGIIGAMALPYLQNLWVIAYLPYYAETTRRIGQISSRYPAGLGTQATALILIGVWLLFRFTMRQRENQEEKTMFDFHKVVAGLSVAFVVLNQQMITGMELEFNSHYFALIILFAVAIVGGISQFLIFDSKKTNKVRDTIFAKTLIVLWITSTLFFIGYWVFGQVRQNAFHNPNSYWDENIIAITQWFRKNNIHDVVIYAPLDLLDPIHMLSENYLVFHPNEAVFLISNKELIDRFTYFDIGNKELTQNLIAHQNLIFGHTFDAAWQKDNVIGKMKALLARRPFVPIPIEKYIAFDFDQMYRARQNITALTFNDYLKRYHVDYVVYAKEKSPNLFQNLRGSIVFENNRYVIMQVSR